VSLEGFPYRAAADWLYKGEMVPFLGAGAARAGLADGEAPPDGRALARALLELQSIDGLSAEDDLARVAQAVEYRLDRKGLIAAVHQAVCQKSFGTSAVSTLLASLPQPEESALLMVTTNYDTQVEAAFEAAERPLCVLTHTLTALADGPSQLDVRRPDGTSRRIHVLDFTLDAYELGIPRETAFLYKIHGDLCRTSADEPDNVILTEEDYIRFLGAMGSGMMQFLPPNAINAFLKKRRFLFLGYSLRDWNLRVILGALQQRRTLSDDSALHHYSIQRSASPIDKKLWDKKNVEVVEEDLILFVHVLREALDDVAKARVP
jgi:hypothetical protein